MPVICPPGATDIRYCVLPGRAVICSGQVNVRYQKRGTTISSRNVTVRSDCTYRSRVTFHTRLRYARRHPERARALPGQPGPAAPQREHEARPRRLGRLASGRRRARDRAEFATTRRCGSCRSALAPIKSVMRILLAVLIAMAGLAVTATGAQATASLTLGFYDPVYREASAPWLARSADAGADIVKIDAGWPAADAPRSAARPRRPGVRLPRDRRAPCGPPRARAPDPARLLRARRRGRRAPDAPRTSPPGTWRPTRPRSVTTAPPWRGATRAATPIRSAPPGSTLPRVRAFQVWNEPNLAAVPHAAVEGAARRLARVLPARC